MSPQANSAGFIYLDQNGLLLFTSATPSVLQLPFAADVATDLEVISKELLEKEIDKLFKANNIGPTKYIIGLSTNLLFEKPFQNAQSPETQKEIEKFLDNIPFEHVGTVIYENAESRIIATNKDFFQSIVKILQQHNGTVEYIIPSYILGVDVNQALAMTPQMLSDVHKKASALKQYSFLVDASMSMQQKRDTAPPAKDKSPEKSSENQPQHQFAQGNRRQLVLVGVFVLLLVILGVTFFMSSTPS